MKQSNLLVLLQIILALIVVKVSSLMTCKTIKSASVLKMQVDINPIPVDISRFIRVEIQRDFEPPVIDSFQEKLLLPENSIQTLSGGENLGILLWTFVLYQGLFTSSGRPADWIVKPLAVLLQKTNETWFEDYECGYLFECPPSIEFARVGIFFGLSVAWNRLLVQSLGDDSFWGWSIAACLAIPSGLIAISRNKPPTREVGELRVAIEKEFGTFASKVLKPSKNGRLSEKRLIQLYKTRSKLDLFDETTTDPLIKKVIRKYLGRRPENGEYIGLDIISLKPKPFMQPVVVAQPVVKDVTTEVLIPASQRSNAEGAVFMRD